MALKINSESLKNVSNLVIDCRLAQEIGVYVFNNMGTVSEEFTELCNELHKACDKIIAEAQTIKSSIPA